MNDNSSSEPLVSVIIPSYNRFKYVINAVKSIQNQTYNTIEIIVINDCSQEKEYYSHKWSDDVNVIHLKNNSKKMFGYGCVGHVRNKGIEKAKGKYVAFCDDDDYWLPNKLEIQIKGLRENNNCKMCCTDGYIGKGPYNSKKKYRKYNAEHYFNTLNKKYKNKLSKNGFPKIWDLKFLKVHNCAITSSMIIERKLLRDIDGMPFHRRGQDYRCWLNALHHTKCLYLTDTCFYYDTGHGDGKNH